MQNLRVYKNFVNLPIKKKSGKPRLYNCNQAKLMLRRTLRNVFMLVALFTLP